jgi:predicted XRE-type DNA-binding protein
VRNIVPYEPLTEDYVPADGNVFLALGFEPGEAANLLIRADLMMHVEDIIKTRGLKQKEAARLFGVSQPRISDVKRGKIDAFTIDSLVNMLGTAGMQVEVTVMRALPESATTAAEVAPEETSAARA